MGGSMENRYISVRKKLDELGYREAFGIESLSLVERLLRDLLTNSESLKQSLDEASTYKKLARELEEGVEPFKEENLRLIKENSQLRLAVQKNEEKVQEKLHGWKSKLRDLEDENADLKLLITEFVDRVKKQEVDSLEKTRRLAQLQERNLQAAVIFNDGTKYSLGQRQQMEIDSPAPQLCPHCTRIRNLAHFGKKIDPTAVDYLKVADSRIEALTIQNRSLRQSQQDLLDLIKSLKKGIEMRETELEKLKENLRLGLSFTGSKEMIGGGDHDVDSSPCRDLQIALKSAQLQLQILQKRNLNLEKKLQNNLLQIHDDFVLNRNNRSLTERNLYLNFMDSNECMFLPRDNISMEDKLMLLEKQLSHCCQEKAKLKALLEDCERTHKKRRNTPDREVPGKESNVEEPMTEKKDKEERVSEKTKSRMISETKKEGLLSKSGARSTIGRKVGTLGDSSTSTKLKSSLSQRAITTKGSVHTASKISKIRQGDNTVKKRVSEPFEPRRTEEEALTAASDMNRQKLRTGSAAISKTAVAKTVSAVRLMKGRASQSQGLKSKASLSRVEESDAPVRETSGVKTRALTREQSFSDQNGTSGEEDELLTWDEEAVSEHRDEEEEEDEDEQEQDEEEESEQLRLNEEDLQEDVRGPSSEEEEFSENDLSPDEQRQSTFGTKPHVLKGERGVEKGDNQKILKSSRENVPKAAPKAASRGRMDDLEELNEGEYSSKATLKTKRPSAVTTRPSQREGTSERKRDFREAAAEVLHSVGKKRESVRNAKASEPAKKTTSQSKSSRQPAAKDSAKGLRQRSPSKERKETSPAKESNGRSPSRISKKRKDSRERSSSKELRESDVSKKLRDRKSSKDIRHRSPSYEGGEEDSSVKRDSRKSPPKGDKQGRTSRPVSKQNLADLSEEPASHELQEATPTEVRRPISSVDLKRSPAQSLLNGARHPSSEGTEKVTGKKQGVPQYQASTESLKSMKIKPKPKGRGKLLTKQATHAGHSGEESYSSEEENSQERRRSVSQGKNSEAAEHSSPGESEDEEAARSISKSATDRATASKASRAKDLTSRKDEAMESKPSAFDVWRAKSRRERTSHAETPQPQPTREAGGRKDSHPGLATSSSRRAPQEGRDDSQANVADSSSRQTFRSRGMQLQNEGMRPTPADDDSQKLLGHEESDRLQRKIGSDANREETVDYEEDGVDESYTDRATRRTPSTTRVHHVPPTDRSDPAFVHWSGQKGVEPTDDMASREGVPFRDNSRPGTAVPVDDRKKSPDRTDSWQLPGSEIRKDRDERGQGASLKNLFGQERGGGPPRLRGEHDPQRGATGYGAGGSRIYDQPVHSESRRGVRDLPASGSAFPPDVRTVDDVYSSDRSHHPERSVPGIDPYQPFAETRPTGRDGKLAGQDDRRDNWRRDQRGSRLGAGPAAASSSDYRSPGYVPFPTTSMAARQEALSDTTDLYNRIRALERTIDNLQIESNRAKASKADLEQEVMKLRRALAECQEHGRQLMTENQKTKIMLEHTEALLKDTQRKAAANYVPTQRENQELNQQVRQLMAREMGLERELASLTATVKALDRDKDEMRVELDRKDEKLARVQMENSQLTEQVHTLQLQLKNAELQLGHTGETSRDQEREMMQLKRQLNDLKADLEHRIRERDAAQRELNRLTQSSSKTELEKRNMRVELERQGKEADELRRQVQKYIDEVRRIEDLLARKEEELEQLMDSYRSLSQEKVMLESQQSLLEREAAAVRGDAVEAIESGVQLTSQLTSKQQVIQAYEQEIEQLSNQVASLENQLRSTQDREKMLQADLKAARDLCLKLETNLDNTRLNASSSDSMKNKLQAENAELRSHLEILEVQLEAETESKKKLEDLLAKMREKEYQAEAMINSLKSEKENLTARLASLQSRMEYVSGEMEKHRLKAAELQNELEKIRRQYNNEKMEREAALAELKRMQAQLSTSSTSLLMASTLGPSRSPSPSPYAPSQTMGGGGSGNILAPPDLSPVMPTSFGQQQQGQHDTVIPSPLQELP